MKERDTHYLWTTIALALATFGGFWFTYFGPRVAGTYPTVSAAVHVHGWSFFGWYLLLPLQAAFMHTRRVQLHRTLGWASVALASLMVATGLLVIGVQMQIAASSAEPTFFAFFGPMVFATLVLFAGFYGAAVFRLMSAFVGQVMWVAPVGILATNLFIVWGIVHDYRRDQRVHPAYVVGLVACVTLELAGWLLTPTPVGVALASALAWVGRVGAVLY